MSNESSFEHRQTVSRRQWLTIGLAGAGGALTALEAEAGPNPLPRDDGYRGIWYANQPTKDQYRYKYSGGFATYPQQHIPIAYYSSQANKTFFCYGGTVQGRRELLHMVSYFDHATGMVPKPVILLNKKTDDAHDNPTMMLDDAGHVWIFSNSHGTGRPSYIHRSVRPYQIDAFERVLTTNFSYGQPWFIPKQGFLFLHTHYAQGRNLMWMTSADGRKWSKPERLAKMEMGHYQISWRHGSKIGTAFNFHPKPLGLNARTNLYYLETNDMGKTWRTVDGQVIKTPLTTVQTPALVHNYQAAKQLVYLKDLQFDSQGRPIILYLTSRGYQPGPKNNPRTFYTARWTGKQWEIRTVTQSDHNYDFGSFYVEDDGTWRFIAPTAPGPQPHGTGGDVVLWTSRDQGKSWQMIRQVTRNSQRNHTYVRRPVNAHADFYGLWADGNPLQPSPSALYFTNREGTQVWKLPEQMNNDTARPIVV